MNRGVSRETRLASFATSLFEANRTTNLVSRRLSENDVMQMVSQFAGTIEALGIDPPDGLIDVGSGAGLPGVPLAIAYPGTPVLLCEPRKLRIAWLLHITAALGLENTSMAPGRVESFPELAGTFPVATAFGVGRPTDVVGIVAPLLTPGGLGILSAPNDPDPAQASAWLLAAAVNGCDVTHHRRALGGERSLLTLHRDS